MEKGQLEQKIKDIEINKNEINAKNVFIGELTELIENLKQTIEKKNEQITYFENKLKGDTNLDQMLAENQKLTNLVTKQTE